jgi:hypothetical protein
MMNRIPSLAAAGALAVFCMLGSARPTAAEDWPQWRGPDRDDVSRETGLLPSWPEGGPKQVWIFKNAGNGYSGPAIVHGQLFTLGNREHQKTDHDPDDQADSRIEVERRLVDGFQSDPPQLLADLRPSMQ